MVVSVRTDRGATGAEARLRLAVEDTGAGMEPDELDRLFRPFTQGARFGGTGLGLALSQQLVQLMGWRLDVVSAPGRGSLFTVLVELPVAAHPADEPGTPPPTAAPPAAAPAPAGTATRLRVLVADDNEINLRVAEAQLRAEGVEAVTVGDGADAVATPESAPFDLVLLDMQMPRLSGPDAARAIRGLPGRAGSTPLLALTASSVDEDHDACLQAGMQGVLVKPVRRAQLRSALEDLLG